MVTKKTSKTKKEVKDTGLMEEFVNKAMEKPIEEKDVVKIEKKKISTSSKKTVAKKDNNKVEEVKDITAIVDTKNDIVAFTNDNVNEDNKGTVTIDEVADNAKKEVEKEELPKVKTINYVYTNMGIRYD